MKRALTFCGSPKIIGDPKSTKKINIFGGDSVSCTYTLDILILLLRHGQSSLNFIMAGWMGRYYQLEYAVINISGFSNLASPPFKKGHPKE